MSGPAPGVYLWRGQTYIGRKAVAQAAGVQPQMVTWHLARHGHLDHLGLRHHSLGGNPGGKGARRRAVNKFGRSWPTMTALAREVGRHLSTVEDWLNNDRDDLLLAALMAADARRTRAALRDADMVDRVNRRAAA